ncbi:tripartite tricarboxylate transporter substrate-binding protein [Pseudonocardia sp. ICBG601]|uniref:tripartite tricarboxylate transporter substrate-binding protein n=1 Tax=Pseudonocardia sp. ICBG601 TaxID=2846759 RepID=UPI0027E2BC07|nr:tripartite tricarboxylate transporter substrate-binding protein [Pseudonocardia sp. ICBG601]
MLVLALAAVVVPIVLTGGPRPLSDLRILVPNPPGGGYDVTARSAAKVLSDNGITGPVEVFNLSGAGGIAGLGRIEGEAGNGRLLMSMGLGVVGATASRDTPLSLADTTPIARLTEESEIVVVPADSPYRDVRALLDAWHAAPGGLRHRRRRLDRRRAGPPRDDAAGRGRRHRAGPGPLRVLRGRRSAARGGAARRGGLRGVRGGRVRRPDRDR